jgi:putative protein-disulfide isomerase
MKKKNTLINVYDPLCGWCYGFGPVMVQLEEKYKDRIDFDVISGGMITGTRIGPLSNMAQYIKQAYKVVEQSTGVKFGKEFVEKTLEEGKAVFSSLEPAKALTIFKHLNKSTGIKFSHEIQKLIYWDGIDPTQLKAYLPLFEQYGLDSKTVLPLFASKDMEQETINEFALAQRWKINGFPGCIVQLTDGKAVQISSGYLPFEQMEKKIEGYLQ